MLFFPSSTTINGSPSRSQMLAASENGTPARAAAPNTGTYAGDSLSYVASGKKASHFLRLANRIGGYFRAGRDGRRLEVQLSPVVDFLQSGQGSGMAPLPDNNSIVMETLLSKTTDESDLIYDNCENRVCITLNALIGSMAMVAEAAGKPIKGARLTDKMKNIAAIGLALEKQRVRRMATLKAAGGDEFKARCRANFQTLVERAQGSSTSSELSIEERYMRAHAMTCNDLFTDEQKLFLNDVFGPESAYQNRFKQTV
jgi:hypothetical protein